MATITLRPNANGDLTELSQYPNSGSHWDKVDEITPDYSATTVYVISSGGSDLFNLEDTSVSGPISNVAVYMVWDNSNEYTEHILTKTEGTLYSVDAPFVASWTTSHVDYALNPKTGVAWTWTEINALQIGTTLSDAGGCTQMYAIVTYTPYTDIGLRIRTSSATIKIGVQDLEATHKLRIRKGATTYGIPLVATTDVSASGLRIYDGATVKALPIVA